jgi:hypothetical protein
VSTAHQAAATEPRFADKQVGEGAPLCARSQRGWQTPVDRPGAAQTRAANETKKRSVINLITAYSACARRTEGSQTPLSHANARSSQRPFWATPGRAAPTDQRPAVFQAPRMHSTHGPPRMNALATRSRLCGRHSKRPVSVALSGRFASPIAQCCRQHAGPKSVQQKAPVLAAS